MERIYVDTVMEKTKCLCIPIKGKKHLHEIKLNSIQLGCLRNFEYSHEAKKSLRVIFCSRHEKEDKMELIKIKKVSVERREGKTVSIYKKEFESIELAQAHIDEQNKWYEYPSVGYDKHKIILSWVNGKEYCFRLDCTDKNHSIKDDLKQTSNYYNKLEPNDLIDVSNKEFFESLKEYEGFN